jgi:hypothetical protein
VSVLLQASRNPEWVCAVMVLCAHEVFSESRIMVTMPRI